MFDRGALKSDNLSWNVSLALALASELTYLDDEAVIDVAKTDWGFVDCSVTESGETKAFVASDADCVVVGFRGSERVEDWLLTLGSARVERDYGHVQGGFFNRYERIGPDVAATLQQIGAAGKKVWLTGHGLGGALATIAAAESMNRGKIAGICTFGQPRVVDERAAQRLCDEYAGRFHRFVNGNDISPLVPPGYRHVGRLIQLDPQRGAEPLGGGFAGGMVSTQGPELDQIEFERLKERLRWLRGAGKKGRNGTKSELSHGGEGAWRLGVLAGDVVDLLSGIHDHRIRRYVDQVRYQVEGPAQVDDLIAQAIDKGHRGGARAETAEVFSTVEAAPGGGTESTRLSEDTTLPVLLRVRNADWTAPPGVTVQSRLGTVVTAFASPGQLEVLRADRGVVSMETSQEGGGPELASSKPFVHADQVHRPPLSETGDAAIVGIIDSGIDVLHKAFVDEHGQTRILYVWDQRGSGNAPNTVDGSAFTHIYGTLYQSAEIQQMVARDQAPEALRDRGGHGTHVASIAAGRAVDSFAGGIAPGAKLIVVIPNSETEPGRPPSIGYSMSHVDALQFIRSAAEKHRLPVVINVSQGKNAGAHDGKSLLESAFDGFSGQGRDPGYIVVKSAGNERGHKGHASATVPLNGFTEITWESKDLPRSKDYIEIWFYGSDRIEFTLTDPNGHKTATVSEANPQVDTTLGGNRCELKLTRPHLDNGDGLLALTISKLDGGPKIQKGTWSLEMLGKRIRKGGIVHAWVERHGARAVSFNSGDTDEMTLTVPGTAESVITVSACKSESQVRLYEKSSRGLTRDEREKPDICAPGVGIVAALAHRDGHQETTKDSGTSMAAPHVAGSIALVFSLLHKDKGKDQANFQQVLQELTDSAQNFSIEHNPDVGWGVLDTLAFFNRFRGSV